MSHAEKIQRNLGSVPFKANTNLFRKSGDFTGIVSGKKKTEEYLRLIRDIRMKNREIEFAPNQRKRIKDLKQKIS